MSLDFNTPALQRYRVWRYTKDRIARVGIALGGMAVIGAVLLIFFYLLFEIMPLFRDASIRKLAEYDVAGSSRDVVYLATEEQVEVGLRISRDGEFRFFRMKDGTTLNSTRLEEGESISAFGVKSEESQQFVVATDKGRVLFGKHDYHVSFPDNKRLIEPSILWLYKGVIDIKTDTPLQDVVFNDGEEALIVAGVDNGGRLQLWRFNRQHDFLMDETTYEQQTIELPDLNANFERVALDASQRWLFALSSDNQLHVFNISGSANGSVTLQARTPLNKPVTDMRMLVGGISLLVSHDDGSVVQWFMAREAGEWKLANVRQFDSGEKDGGLIAVEQRRKGFATADLSGHVHLFHSTAGRQVLSEKITDGVPLAIAISPRANAMMVESDNGKLQVWHVNNRHPEISWSALWGKVWYENYEKPDYIWQSSAANSDFEPKYSFMPLAFGTLKAAFYSLLLGAPLAIMGAIYTAYFMSPKMRGKVKPLVELMGALPTVILGFLAGLWLAPFMEHHLAAIFMLLFVMPIAVLAVSYLFTKLPASIRHSIPEGWEGAMLVPVVFVIGWLCVASNGYVEVLFFGGDMRSWISHDLGIPFDQRNALVVGIAMAVAVIPMVFSIAEDAIFSVPKHLTYGSLALGATTWQTLVGVVLPTASPGIFSALMIGLGRAVGETMIVLMATGNTPIMEANIFEGMRTLAANIAVEVGETEVGGTHYRVLFLAALVLFMFTFVVNTIAEVVRQRLRTKYGAV
jgi:phosphate transport system permease protein